MNEVTVLIIGALVKYGPDLARSLVALLSKTTPPSDAEWAAIFKLADKPYEDYVK